MLDKYWTVQYFYSFYWSFTTLITYSYGDIVPVNEPEIVVVLVYIAIAWIAVSIIVDTTVTIITDYSDLNKQINFEEEL